MQDLVDYMMHVWVTTYRAVIFAIVWYHLLYARVWKSLGSARPGRQSPRSTSPTRLLKQAGGQARTNMK